MLRTLTRCFSLFVFFAIMVLAQSAGAFETYSNPATGIGNCFQCHGDFDGTGFYISLVSPDKDANPVWPGNLHNVHRNSSTSTPPGMLNSNCNACHSGPERTPVSTFSSDGAAPFGQSCIGCHDGPGLRAHHRNSLADSCGSTSCHVGDPTPDPENALPPVYGAAFGTTSGTTRVNDPCNAAAAGFEGRLADVVTIGLDNDGDLLYDAADPDCGPANQRPTLGPLRPSTLTSAAGVAKTFTAVYRDADGQGDLKTVDFLVSPTGSTANAIMVRYFVQTNRLRIFNDAGTVLKTGSCTPGVAGTLQNAQGSVNCGLSSANGAANSLTMKFRVIPKAAFAGLTAKQMKMRAIDQAGATTGLKLKGNWTIN